MNPTILPVATSTVRATARLLILVLAIQSAAPQTFAPQRSNNPAQERQSRSERTVEPGKPIALEKPGPAARGLVPASAQPSALFVAGSTTLTTSDAAIKTRLEGLGYLVTVKSGSGSATTDADNKNLIVISATVTSTDVNTKYRDVTVPVIVCESALFDDMK
ncbi:MAG TPA: hypothetical protein VFV34_00530, partial [Blastocatellia bacterium]|nr:hypothetical protein [Blastocatellia bacterium]